VALIVAILGWIDRQVDIAAVAFNSFGCFANACLHELAWDVMEGAVGLTSLKDMDTPGNFSDSTTVMPSGLGGNDAADASSASEHVAQACSLNILFIDSTM
jgi:hypothetical protein